MHEFSFLRKIREWLQRDVEIQVWDPHKGLVKEKEMRPIIIHGKVWATDDQKTRTILKLGPNSFGVTVNPQFIAVLCPKEKQTTQQLIKQDNGEFVLAIQSSKTEEST